MARRHLTPKQHLGNELDEHSVSIAERLAALVLVAEEASAAAEAQAAAFEGVGDDLLPKGSQVANDAMLEGAEILFASGKQGPITSLMIILIPEEHRENRRVAVLAATFGFVVHLSGRRRIAVAVPKGYVTDFASIPGFAQWLISPFGRHSEAAVVHDWLYTLGTRGDWKSRKLADQTFRKALALVGVKFIRRNFMYWAVRIGGASGFGLESDYDFRDLQRLKRQTPMPDRKTLAITWKEAEIPRAPKAGKNKRAQAAAPPPAPPAPQSMPEPVAMAEAPAPEMSEAEAKAEAQDTMVATESR